MHNWQVGELRHCALCGGSSLSFLLHRADRWMADILLYLIVLLSEIGKKTELCRPYNKKRIGYTPPQLGPCRQILGINSAACGNKCDFRGCRLFLDASKYRMAANPI